MNPIISPLTIYLINLTDPLRTVVIITAVIMVVLSILFGIDYTDRKDSASDKNLERAQKSLKKTKKFAWLSILCLFLAIFIPKKTTLIEMIVAQNVTVDNLNAGEEKLKEAIDYLVDKVEEVKE